MHHCTRCRADAAGLLGDALNDEQVGLLRRAAAQPLDPGDQRPYVAVATREDVLVNLHLGEAIRLSIYRPAAEEFELVETRDTPEPGSGNERWEQLAEILSDCRAVLASSAGQAPTAALARRGIKLVMMEGLIEEGLQAVFAGRPLRSPLRREHRCGAGAACSGNGMGCG
jgi:nitrogen fixation protein NifB